MHIKNAQRIGLIAIILVMMSGLAIPQIALAITRQEAVDLVTSMLIVGQPHESEILALAEHTQLFAGDVVYPELEAGAGDTVTVLNDTWFIFIDDHSMDEYVHDVRYAFVDDNGVVMWVGAKSWPVINGSPRWNNNSGDELIDWIEADEVVFGYDHIMFEEVSAKSQGAGAKRGETQIEFYNDLSALPASALGSNDGAVICSGTDHPRHKQGADSLKEAFSRQPVEVPAGNMHHDNNCSKQDFCDALDSIAAKPPLDKLYIAFVGHGGTDDGNGNWYLWFENGDGKLTGDELREKLKKTKAKRICVVIYACHSGCLIPFLKGAADSVDVAASSTKDATTRTWSTITYVDKNDNDSYDKGVDSVVSIKYQLHYLDAFIGCLDSSRNWQQTHEWAVSQLDSADSAHQQPPFGSHGKAVPLVDGTNNIVIDDKTLWLGLPPSAPPQTIDIELLTIDPVGELILPLFVDVGLGGAFPLLDPGYPNLGVDPLFGPPIFENIIVDPLGIDHLPPDQWFYDLQNLNPPPLNPGIYPELVQLPLVGLDPFPGNFDVQPAGPIQLLDPGFTPLPFIFSPGDFDVMIWPNQPPSIQQIVFIPPPDPLLTGYNIPLLGYDPEGDPLTFQLLTGPLGSSILPGSGPNQAQLIIPPEPLTSGLELMLQGVVQDPFSVGGKSAQQATASFFTFFITVPGPACLCPAQGDGAPLAGPGDGIVNVLDVVASIDEVFRSGPTTFQDPTCPNARLDIAPIATCGDGIKNVLDVVALIDHVFRSGPAPCDPCTAPAAGFPRTVSAPGDGKTQIKTGGVATAALGRLTGAVSNNKWTVVLEIDAPKAWQAAQIEVRFDHKPGDPDEIEVTSSIPGLEPYWSFRGSELIVGLLDFHGEARVEEGTRTVLHITGTGEQPAVTLDDGLLVSARHEAIPLQEGEISIASALPTEYRIGPNYPNPFNAGTVITYAIGNDTHVNLTIYDVLGRRVRTLIDKFVNAGTHEIAWDGQTADGRPVASGMYFSRLTAGEFTQAHKMMLLK